MMTMASIALTTLAILCSTTHSRPLTPLEALINQATASLDENDVPEHNQDEWSEPQFASESAFWKDPHLLQSRHFGLHDEKKSGQIDDLDPQDLAKTETLDNLDLQDQTESDETDAFGLQDRKESDLKDQIPSRLAEHDPPHHPDQNQEAEEKISALPYSQRRASPAKTAVDKDRSRYASETKAMPENTRQTVVDEAVARKDIPDSKHENIDDMESRKAHEVSLSDLISNTPNLLSSDQTNSLKQVQNDNMPPWALSDVQNTKAFTQNDDTIDEDEAHLASHVKDLQLPSDIQRTTLSKLADSDKGEDNTPTSENNNQQSLLADRAQSANARNYENIDQQTLDYEPANEPLPAQLSSQIDTSPKSNENTLTSDFTAGPHNKEDNFKQDAAPPMVDAADFQDSADVSSSSSAERRPELASLKASSGRSSAEKLKPSGESTNTFAQNDATSNENSAGSNPTSNNQADILQIVENGNKNTLRDAENFKSFTQYDETIDEVEAHLASHIKALKLSSRNQQTSPINPANTDNNNINNNIDNNKELTVDDWAKFSTGKNGEQSGTPTLSSKNDRSLKDATAEFIYAVKGSANGDSSVQVSSETENSPASKANELASSFIAGAHNEEDHFEQMTPSESRRNVQASQTPDSHRSEPVNSLPSPEHTLSSLGDPRKAQDRSPESSASSVERRPELAFTASSGQRSSEQSTPSEVPPNAKETKPSKDTQTNTSPVVTEADIPTEKLQDELSSANIPFEKCPVYLCIEDDMSNTGSSETSADETDTSSIRDPQDESAPSFTSTFTDGEKSSSASLGGKSGASPNVAMQNGQVASELETTNSAHNPATKSRSLNSGQEGGSGVVAPTSDIGDTQAATSDFQKNSEHLVPLTPTHVHSTAHLNQPSTEEGSTRAQLQGTDSAKNIHQARSHVAPASLHPARAEQRSSMPQASAGTGSANSLHQPPSPAAPANIPFEKCPVPPCIEDDMSNTGSSEASADETDTSSIRDPQDKSDPSFTSTFTDGEKSSSASLGGKSGASPNVAMQNGQVASELETTNSAHNPATKSRSLNSGQEGGSGVVAPTSDIGDTQAATSDFQKNSEHLVPLTLSLVHSTAHLNQPSTEEGSTRAQLQGTDSAKNIHQARSHVAPASLHPARAEQRSSMPQASAGTGSAKNLHQPPSPAAPASWRSSRQTVRQNETRSMGTKHLAYSHFRRHHQGITNSLQGPKFYTNQENSSQKTQPRQSGGHAYGSSNFDSHNIRHASQNQISQNDAQQREFFGHQGIRRESSSYRAGQRLRHRLTKPLYNQY